jgi:hypothetical protein
MIQTKTKTKTIIAIATVGFAVASVAAGTYLAVQRTGIVTKSKASVSIAAPNGGQSYYNDQKIPFTINIKSSKIGSLKIWMYEESTKNYYPVKTVSATVNPASIGYVYKTEFDPATVKPVAGTSYRSFVEWISNDGVERLSDQGDGNFSIQ